jgi:hypothetical protein
VDVDVDGTLSIANAAAGPHAGALRAGIEITDVAVSGSGFSVTGIETGDWIGAGQTLNAEAHFNAIGKLAGTYFGSAEVSSVMNSQPGSFLNGRTPMDDVVWQLRYTVPTITDDMADFGVGQDFSLAIAATDTAAALVGGSSSTAQEVALGFIGNPETGGEGTAAIVGSAVEIHFEQDGDLYVLQLTYDDASLPPGMLETDLRLLFFDPDLNAWIDAIDANSDGGAGEQFHLGSFSDFVATLGGGPLPLSAHGVDIEENTVWAVLNHASVFAAGVVPAPGTATLLVLSLLVFARRQRRR